MQGLPAGHRTSDQHVFKELSAMFAVANLILFSVVMTIFPVAVQDYPVVDKFIVLQAKREHGEGTRRYSEIGDR